ncbi:MAG: hypothetical protein IT435_20385 [Phycisphaerales bacterium]|nr:hypothetical protein [Phycisphaerales bacterium]
MPLRHGESSRAAGDAAPLACRAGMRLTPGFEHRVLAIGGSDTQRRLERLGVAVRDRVSPPLGRPGLARGAISGLLRLRERFDVVQPWHASLVDAIDPAVVRIAAPPTHELLGALLEITDRLEEEDLLRRARGEELRSQLGIDGTRPVVLFAADPPDDGEAAWLFRIIGMTDKAGERFTLVIPRGVRGIHRAAVLHRDALITSPLVVSERSGIELLDAADIAVLPRSARRDRYPAAALAAARGLRVIEPTSDVVEGGDESLNPACATEYALTAAALRDAIHQWQSHRRIPPGVCKDQQVLADELMARWTR